MSKIQITIPESYADVSVKQYKRMMSEIKDVEEETEIAIRAVAALCDLDRKVLNHAPVHEIAKCIEAITWLIQEPDITKSEIPLQKTFYLNGVEYGFIPNWTKLTVGEFADIESYTSDTYGNLEKIMAVLYRPVTQKKADESYSIEAYEPHHTKQENMLNCKMNVVIGAMVFFYHIGREFVKDTHRYSKSQKNKKKTQSIQSGGGMVSYIRSLMGI